MNERRLVASDHAARGAIAASSSHTCAIVNGGAVCWGANTSGELGNNSMSQSLIPVDVTGANSGVKSIRGVGPWQLGIER